MKAIALFFLGSFLCGCSTSVKFLAYDTGLQSGAPLQRVALVNLDGAAYPVRHNIYAVQNINFHQAADVALENAVKTRRKAWRLTYPTAVAAADASMRDTLAIFKDRPDSISGEAKASMKKLAGILETRYFLLLESIALKDASNPQVPAALIAGMTIQLWDFETGKVIYRARSSSRTVDYSDKEMKKKLKEALFDLACDLIGPLPKK